MNTYLQTALSSATVAGEVLLDYFNKLHDSNNKSGNFRDIVTDVDLLSEREIINNIIKKHPDHSIVAEESGVKIKNKQYKWYIDPLDGTVNYANGIPLSVISIALTIDDVISVGVIYNPFTCKHNTTTDWSLQLQAQGTSIPFCGKAPHSPKNSSENKARPECSCCNRPGIFRDNYECKAEYEQYQDSHDYHCREQLASSYFSPKFARNQRLPAIDPSRILSAYRFGNVRGLGFLKCVAAKQIRGFWDRTMLND